MKRQTARLLCLGLVAFFLGCRPDASERRSDLALAGAAPGTQPRLARQNPQDELVIRRLWEGPDPQFWSGSVSPDGRFVSQVISPMDLGVIDLLSGEVKRVNKGPWDTGEYPEESFFSADGRQLLFKYWSEDPQGYEIRTIGIDGSDQKVVWPNPGGDVLKDADLKDWSDDGLHILALVWDGQFPSARMQIGLISLVDGSIRYLKEFRGRGVESSVCVLSPDGRLVAYDLSSSLHADHDIYLLPVDGGREVDLLTGPADDRLLGWMPDGSGVLFYSDRGLTQGIWLLRVSDGRPAGEPMLLRGDLWGLEPIGFSRDAYYYGVMTQRPQLHTTIIDPQTWRLVTPPAAIEDPSLGTSAIGVWSPDGRHLAYMRESQRGWTVVIRSVTGDDSREIALSPIEARGLIKWTDDGQALLMGASDSSGVGVFKLDLSTGAAGSIWQWEPPFWPRFSQLSRDLKTAYFARRWPEEPSTREIVARDLASGRERQITTTASIASLSLSPDGRTLAFADGDRPPNVTRIATVSTSGGEIRELYRAAGAEELHMDYTMPWSSDGRYVVFLNFDAGANRYSLWRVPAAGGEPSRMELPLGDPPGMRWLSLHPDGNRIAFNSRRFRGEIWVVENLPGTR